MPRRTAAIALALLLTVALTACTSPSAPESTPAPTPPATPTPAPASETVLLDPGSRPPSVFGGDCEAAVPAGVIAEATGLPVTEVTRRDPLWTRAIDNVGGLVCEWHIGGAEGSVSILPVESLDGAELAAASYEDYFVECGWTCAWVVESDELWISGYQSDLPERGRAEADRIGARIGADIAARVSAAGLDWQSDRAQWWSTRECSSVASAVGATLGATLTGEPIGYHDPPLPATLVADTASRRTWCLLAQGGATIALVVFESGVAWDVPWGGDAERLDLGVPGVTAYSVGAGGYLGGPDYEFTDGVNSLSLEVAPDAPWSPDELASIMAELTASDVS
ncbi:hypothetical protein SAMN04487846_0884 [Microbacterium sp. cf046]|uniref:hypothetical protein n=1 Tax=Microbacterium sp. cf046 TaxID=1761803 RepID=UPI0008EA68BE|nr:hypothetical protein [Microbacterium sp. cf046]SFR93962.1 hypothetical protein SAMN04487846_0884 [Microbacterium sp. cf046]